jgi:RNA polymerase sigma factor (sigma-70 family)
MPTTDPEIELGRRVRGGDLSARNELVERNRCFALQIANSYMRRCRCWESDLDQAALLGLIRGANAFDPDRYPGRKFLTIARYYVRLEILEYLYGRQLIRVPHSARPSELAKRPIGAMETRWKQYREWSEMSAARATRVAHGQDDELDCPDPSQCCPGLADSLVEDIEQLRLGLEMLPPWHAEVLSRHFGLAGRSQETADTIASSCGVSRSEVFRTKKSALRQLRKILVAS